VQRKRKSDVEKYFICVLINNKKIYYAWYRETENEMGNSKPERKNCVELKWQEENWTNKIADLQSISKSFLQSHKLAALCSLLNVFGTNGKQSSILAL
jgi:hypothetical protein